MKLAAILTALALATPAFAAELPVCEIVVAWDRGSKHEILAHERAHCHGWTHPAQAGVRKAGHGAYAPPAELTQPYPNEIIRRVSTARAKRICGSFGCAMGGLLPN